MKETLPGRVRFGAFELDLNTGELCLDADGGRNLLQEQPFQVLRILIGHDGEIATREEIKRKLWPNNTVVEFDHCINVAIGTLRRLLGDSADSPKYIETLARRGYRLMVPIEWAVEGHGPSAGSGQAFSRAVSGNLQPGALAPAPAKESSGPVGRTVSHYRVLEIIGGGGMGVVYRAEDLKLGRQVALKFLPEELGSQPQALERFSREARAASSLDHPNICHIYEFGEHEGQPFIVMQLMEGQTLRDRLAKDERVLPLAELLDIAIQVSDGLQAAHEKGIIHRDIKPANIFLTSKGVVKILDFGLAKLMEAPDKEQTLDAVILSDEVVSQRETTEESKDPYNRDNVGGIGVPRLLGMTHENDALDGTPEGVPLQNARADATLTRTGVAMGSVGYMSPEQVRGERLDARSDIFSFGLVLYEMATGRRAFTGETAAVVHDAILNDLPVHAREMNSTLPAKLVTTIDKALEKDRERRYQSAAEMRADLEGVRSRERRLPRLHGKWFVAAAVVMVLAAGGSLYWQARNKLKLTSQDTIVLADFRNRTSDRVLDDALNTALRVELEQTPFLNVLSSDKVRGTLREMNRPEDTRVTEEVARDVCLKTNSKALVAGSISDAGNRYRLGLRAVGCQSGKTLASAEAEVGKRNEIVRTLGVVGAELREKLGEPKGSLRKFNKPLNVATSTSLEAIQAFAEGSKLQMQQGSAAAIPYLKRAVELDPNYAYPYAWLGSAYSWLSQTELGVGNLTKAYNLRERLSERERFAVESAYYYAATGESDKAIRIYEQWVQTYPLDWIPHLNFSGMLATVGQFEKGAAEAHEANRISPTVYGYTNLMGDDVFLGRFDDAKSAFEEARAINLDGITLRSTRYIVAFLQGDEASMQEQVTWAAGKPGLEDQMIWLQSLTEAYHGRFRNADRYARAAADSARRANPANLGPDWEVSEALQDVEVGRLTRAHEAAAAALTRNPDRFTRLKLALIFARTGDTQQAQNLAEALNQELPLSVKAQKYHLPTIRAAIELDRNQPERAIEVLQPVVPYELSTEGESLNEYEELYPAYVRGLAYLQAGEGQRAATEFQKLLDYRGVVGIDIKGALAHLQLGRAQAMMGDKAAARKSYQDFLTLWKDADPDIPIYKQAKAEYARLQ